MLLCWLLVTVVVAWRATSSSRPPASAAPPPQALPKLVLLRPCAGADPQLKQALLSSRAMGKGSRVRFLLATAEDSAAAVAAEVASSLRDEGMDAQVLITNAASGNRKASQLAAAERVFEDEPCIFIVADADVLLTAPLLAQLVKPLASFSVGASWSPPLELSQQTLGDRASKSILDASLHAFPLLARLDPRGMVGKCFAIRSERLKEIGGFHQVAQVLGEDMELARKLHVNGYRTEAIDTYATSLAEGRTLGAVLQRYARWISVIRHQRPSLFLSYPLLIAAAPLQLACAMALSLSDQARVSGLSLAGAVLIVRWIVGALARRRSGHSFRGLVAGPWLADLTLLAAWSMVLVGAKLRWRGVPLAFTANGQLREEVRP